MARPVTKSLRLDDLVPEEVAEIVVGAAFNQFRLLVDALGPAVAVAESRHAVEESPLWQAAVRLTVFAQSGELDDAWECEVDAVPDIDEISRLFHGRAGAALQPAVALVLEAAQARVSLELGDGVDAVQLAALADLSPQQVRLLARQGALKLKAGTASAAQAKRWLEARGVAV